jgi:hypothetical protein
LWDEEAMLMSRTLADRRRWIALLLGVFLSLTIAAPAFADTAGVTVTEPGVHVDGVVCTRVGTNGVEWTLITTGTCGPGVGVDGVEWA